MGHGLYLLLRLSNRYQAEQTTAAVIDVVVEVGLQVNKATPLILFRTCPIPVMISVTPKAKNTRRVLFSLKPPF